MDIVTCDGSQLLNAKSRKEDIGSDYIGFKYLKTSDLIAENTFSFVSDRGKLIGVLKYKVEKRKSSGLRGVLGGKFLYVRLYFMDVRSDKRYSEITDIEDYLVSELCDVINSYSERRKIVNISTLKGVNSITILKDTISREVNKVKYIKRGRKRYGK